MIHHETVGKCTRQTGRDVGSQGKRTHLYKVKTRNQTKDLRLTFGTDSPTVLGFSDADGMSSPDRHAISGYVFIVDGGAVSWSSKRQELVTLSQP